MPRATAVRILALALVGGVLFDIVVPGNAPGIGVFVLTLALLVASVAAAGPGGLARMDRADLWLAPVGALMAGFAAVRSEPWLVAADLALAVATSTAAIMALGGARITRGLVPAILDATLEAIAAAAAGAIDVLGAARPAPQDGAVRSGSRQAAGSLAPVARGLVIALPVAAVFTALFASADAVFASIARTVFEWRPDLDVAMLAERTVIVAGVAWGGAGLLALGSGFAPRLLGPAPAAAPAPAWSAPPQWPAAAAPASLPRLGSVEATTVLIVLDALFALFVALQVAYLFGGRDTLATAGITYADYARRGFFELVGAVVAAGMVIVGLEVAVGRRSRPQVAASIGLLALTAVVLVSALARLRLYQEAYGWTELRFVILVAIGWLGAAIVGLGVLLARGRTRWLLHVLGVVSILAVAGMNVVGPGGFVAGQNLARAIDPSLVAADGRAGFDPDYLDALGDAAVPAAVAALGSLPPEDRASVSQFLERRADRLAHDPMLAGWPSWNLDRERAREAIATWRAGLPRP